MAAEDGMMKCNSGVAVEDGMVKRDSRVQGRQKEQEARRG